jgi:UDP-GlcNAc:undecaprenyl-phosphate GlcNAc-1-phosphate transferase
MVSLVLAGTFQQIGGVKLFPPVTALFIVGLPLYDMVFTTIRRALRGMNPMGSDRSHLHHLLLALGFSARRSLVLILAIGTAIPMAGLALHKAGTPELYQFAIFLGGFALYALLVPHAWRVARLLEAQQTSISVSFNTDSTGGSGAESAHAPSDKITRLHG